MNENRRNAFKTFSQKSIKPKKDIKYFFMDDRAFPELITKEKHVIKKTKDVCIDYLEKTKMEQVIETQIEDTCLKPGWVELQLNPTKCIKTICYGSKMTDTIETPASYYDVIDKLSTNYEKWKKKYIENWGEEEYEKMYRFPFYEYENVYDMFITNDPSSDYEEEYILE